MAGSSSNLVWKDGGYETAEVMDPILLTVCESENGRYQISNTCKQLPATREVEIQANEKGFATTKYSQDKYG